MDHLYADGSVPVWMIRKGYEIGGEARCAGRSMRRRGRCADQRFLNIFCHQDPSAGLAPGGAAPGVGGAEGEGAAEVAAEAATSAGAPEPFFSVTVTSWSGSAV